ncbi:MAG: ATP-dependent RecD-like DNA helicase [Candidatus Aminicenantes bacterium]|nr:ATP-dependent RecD-like DNA helicase [Candidatus Aminicenantes bacterium]
MPEYKVRIKKRIFFSEESGFGVFSVSVKGTRQQRVIVGAMLDVGEGDFLHIEGDEIVHPRFGEQIKVKSYQTILPQDEEGMINYLSSGRIKGIGKKNAERIVKKFGKKTFEILEESPERLREVKGVGRNVVAEAKRNSKANKTIRELTVKLSPYGIGSETIIKIFKEFDEDAFSLLESNPYILIDRIRGVGFRIADTIARGFGIAKNDRSRIRAGINFYLTQFEQKNGDLYIDEPELLERAAVLLDTDSAEVGEVVESMVLGNELVREEIPGKVLAGSRNYAIEKASARKLFQLSASVSTLASINVNFAKIFTKIAVELTGEQKEAVIAAVNNRITVITGGPGTGKTTIIRAIIESLKMADKEVAIAAPTGRAAKRIEESSLYRASTIHRLLKIDPETRRFVHDEQNPLKADAVIVDEFSMVDFSIFYSLLKSLSQHTRLIIIGDKDQLPSVGPGNVLRDIIHSDYFDVIYLNRNFRQTEDSLIIENAYRINNGEELIFRPYSEELDFVFVRVNSEAQAREKVLRILEYHKNDYSFNAPGLQILVPMYRGASGIDNLNAAIQAKFNPGPALTAKERISFKKGDKVMQLKNNYDKVIFNGDQGIVRGFNAQDKKLLVDFDGPILEYTGDELDELTLSYAVSVHKAQGSEYDMLIIVLLPTHAIMLNRELFYTAVTRAKRKIFLVSDPVTVGRAVNNSSPSERKTLLPRRLQEFFNPTPRGDSAFDSK